MKLEVRRLGAMALIVLMMVSAVIVYAVPKIPHKFYGQVTIGGSMAPDGTLIEARIDGRTYAETTTVGGRYGYEPTFQVPADDPDTTIVEGGVNGDTIEFYVDGSWAVNHTFLSGAVTELPLEPTIPFEIFLYEGWNLIGLPLIPEDPSIEAVLTDIIYYIESVWAYDGGTDKWSSYAPGAPSDLTQILAGKGYWIKTITDVIWTIDISGYYGPRPDYGANYTWSGRVDRNTEPFYVPSDTIKITWSLELGTNPSFSIRLAKTEDGWYYGDYWGQLQEEPEGDTYAYISPGYYYLDFSVWDCNYTVTVETFSP